MLCCAVILTLLALPAMLVRRYLIPRRGNPLAWRPGAPDAGCRQPEGPAQPLRSFIRNRAQSFVFAGIGIWHVIRHEPAARIHGAATIVALGGAMGLDLTAQDWRWIVLAVLAVWSAEAFNTAIENTCNLLSPHFSEHVRIAKDVAAGAVLLISLGALAIGLLTFWPYLATRLTPVPDQGGQTPLLCLAARSAIAPLPLVDRPGYAPGCHADGLGRPRCSLSQASRRAEARPHVDGGQMPLPLQST